MLTALTPARRVLCAGFTFVHQKAPDRARRTSPPEQTPRAPGPPAGTGRAQACGRFPAPLLESSRSGVVKRCTARPVVLRVSPWPSAAMRRPQAPACKGPPSALSHPGALPGRPRLERPQSVPGNRAAESARVASPFSLRGQLSPLPWHSVPLESVLHTTLSLNTEGKLPSSGS